MPLYHPDPTDSAVIRCARCGWAVASLPRLADRPAPSEQQAGLTAQQAARAWPELAACVRDHEALCGRQEDSVRLGRAAPGGEAVEQDASSARGKPPRESQRTAGTAVDEARRPGSHFPKPKAAPGWGITGSWVGEYSYDPNPSLPAQPPAVPFTLDIRLGWFGDFHGFIQDHPAQGPPVGGTVTGDVAGRRLTFLLRCPEYYFRLGDSRVTLREHLEARGIPLDEDVAPAPVQFKGRYAAADSALRGTWRVDPHPIRFRSNGRILEMPSAAVSGRWTVWRQSGGKTFLGYAIRCLTRFIPYLALGVLALSGVWAVIIVILTQLDRPLGSAPFLPVVAVPAGLVLGPGLAILIHEVGHLLAGRPAGLSPQFVQVGPVLLSRASGHWRLGWDFQNVDRARVIVPPRAGRWRWGLFLLGGPLANLATGVGAAALLAAPLSAPVHCCVGPFAVFSLLGGLINLLPIRSGAQRSDGLQLWCLLTVSDSAWWERAAL